MDFKKIYQEAINEAGSIGNLSRNSYQNYGNKYAKPGSKGNLNDIKPGRVFTFYYNSTQKRSDGFINHRPLLLIVSEGFVAGKKILQGIDLMLLPPLQRLNFLIRFGTIYSKQIETSQKDNNSTAPNVLISEEILETLFSGINYKYAYSGFKLENIINFVEIPINDWKNIIYLNTKSIEGADIEDIYKNNQ